MTGLLQFLGTVFLFVIACAVCLFVVLFGIGMHTEYRRRTVARAVDEMNRRNQVEQSHVSLDEYRSRRRHPTGDATDTYLRSDGGTDR